MKQFLDARTVAVVGASAGKRTAGRIVADKIAADGSRTLWPIHPSAAEIGGHSTYPDFAALPGAPDVTIVAVPGAAVPGAVAEGIAVGCKAFVVLSATSRAVDAATGRSADDALAELLEAHPEVQLLGPSSGGLIDFNRDLFLSFSTLVESDGLRAGGIAFVSQSGGVATYSCALGMRRGAGFSHYVSTGTEAALDVLDIARMLAERDEVTTLCIYIENVRSGPRFLECARAIRARGKALVVLWGGRSAKAQAAALSHTGALAVPERVMEGLCAQSGAILTRTAEECLTVATLADRPEIRGTRTALVSVSGGFAVLMGDLCQAGGLDLPDFSAATREAVAGHLPVNSSFGNPLDLGSVRDSTLLPKVLPALGRDENIDNVIFFTGFGGDTAAATARAIVAARPEGVYFCVIWLAAPPEAAAIVRAAGIDLFEATGDVIAALGRVGALRRPREEAAPAPHAEPAPSNLRALREDESKRYLAEWGVPLPRSLSVANAEATRAAAAQLRAPYVLKGMKTGVIHKAREGAVALHLSDPDAVLAAARRMEAARGDRGGYDAFLVEEMATGELEVIIGISTDPRFGTLLTFGIGGVYTEAINSVAVRALPATREEIRAMIASTVPGAVLAACRSGPGPSPAEIALEDLVVTIADRAPRVPGFGGFDVNPVKIDPISGSVCAVDASMLLLP